MKIAICVNHSYPHCGGSEKVVQHISELLVKDFHHECIVISKSLHAPLENNGVSMIPCPVESTSFINKLRSLKPDITLIYSDCFVHWLQILKEHNKITGAKFLVPVGMNHMLSHSSIMKLFKDNRESFNIITHSDNYTDYTICENLGIPVTVIPNGVDLQEFDLSIIDFKQKYNINKKIILCVSNFFPGKGQEYLVKVLERLKQKREDWVSVFISTSVNFAYANILANKVHLQLKSKDIPYKFLVDISREDTVAAFIAADIFAFPTQKEVSPLVVLESMAARTPWLAMPVGNIPQLKGGIIVPSGGKDKDGYMRYSDISYAKFESNINLLLDSEEENEKLKQEGRALVENRYNWGRIVGQYDSLFRSKHE